MATPVMDGEARKHDAHTRLRAYRAARVCDWHSGLYYRVCCGLARPRPTTFATWCRFRTELGLGFLGAAPSELATAGIIVAAVYRKSRRPEAHARPLTLWHLRDCQAAVAWLAGNPPLPALETTEGAAESPAAPSKQKSLF